MQDNMTNPGNHTMRVLDIAAPIIGYKTNQTIGVVCAFLKYVRDGRGGESCILISLLVGTG